MKHTGIHIGNTSATKIDISVRQGCAIMIAAAVYTTLKNSILALGIQVTAIQLFSMDAQPMTLGWALLCGIAIFIGQAIKQGIVDTIEG